MVSNNTNTETQHTPAPWRVEIGSEGCPKCIEEGGRVTISIIGADNTTMLYDAYHDSYVNLNPGDVSLIIAAPDMLAALKAIMGGQLTGAVDTNAERFQLGLAAIKKAEGR